MVVVWIMARTVLGVGRVFGGDHEGGRGRLRLGGASALTLEENQGWCSFRVPVLDRCEYFATCQDWDSKSREQVEPGVPAERQKDGG